MQFDYPDMDIGANKVSLRKARKNFEAFGFSEERFLEGEGMSNYNYWLKEKEKYIQKYNPTRNTNHPLYPKLD